jgi:nitroreductase
MDRTILATILDAGVRAPSGENCQPWRFVADLEKDTLCLYNVPERDRSLYNFNQFGSLVSHGAVIENIIIAASSFHYDSAVELFPDARHPDLVARIQFKDDKTIPADSLFEYIAKRASNRLAYKTTTLPEANEIRTSAIPESLRNDGRVDFIIDETKKKRLAQAFSYADELLFENDMVHDFLFQHIYWTLRDAEKERSGFYIKELGLAGPQEIVFKLLQKKRFLAFSKKIGFPKIAAKGNVGLYSNVSALGAVIMKGDAPDDFVNGGRIMERAWLLATKLGYDIQPLTAIIFFMQRIQGNAAQDFSPTQIAGIEASYKTVQDVFQLAQFETPVMLFRIGKGKPISHKSLRRPPDITYR